MPIKATPFEHQKQAYLFVRQVLSKPHTGAALLMQMGCGKSLVGVAVMGAMYLDAKINRVLIVAAFNSLRVGGRAGTLRRFPVHGNSPKRLFRKEKRRSAIGRKR